MPSAILYNKNTLEIMRCLPEPHGSGGTPSFTALCRSARIPEDKKSEYRVLRATLGDMLTRDIKNDYKIIRISDPEPDRILDEESVVLVEKPKVDLSVNSTKVYVNDAFSLSIRVSEVHGKDSFSDVDILIEDVKMNIFLESNVVKKCLKFEDPGMYRIRCEDDRFRSGESVTLEVV